MIICHKYKFIFIKTLKTASTSFEIGLSKFCCEQDIITPLDVIDEAKRHELTSKSPQNFVLKWPNWNKRDYIYFLRNRKANYFGGHSSAKFIKNHVNKNIWDNYYKFCFDRNPWDKAISLYYWKTRTLDTPPTFSKFLHNLPSIKLSNYRKYTIDNGIAVDKVYHYENLQHSLKEIKNILGLPSTIELPFTKDKIRTDRSHYKKLINEPDKKIIDIACSKEIELMGYTF